MGAATPKDLQDALAHHIEGRSLPEPTSADGSWTAWSGPGWSVMLDPGGIVARTFDPLGADAALGFSTAVVAAALHRPAAVPRQRRASPGGR